MALKRKNLSPSVWKFLHMLVYPAYGLLVLHVTLGALHAEGRWLDVVLLGVGVAVVAGLHGAAGWREWLRDRQASASEKADHETWVEVGSVDDIPNNRAKVVCKNGSERIAVFRYGCKGNQALSLGIPSSIY